MSLTFDHLAITAENLDLGRAYVEDALGVKTTPGGAHPDMGTHNCLLALGPSTYLEVIAIDPAGQPPANTPRWFDLDNRIGPPGLTHWVCRSDDLDTDLANAPKGLGTPKLLRRGDLSWQFTVSDTGKLPYDEACPAIISWGDTPHPAARMPDQGVSLVSVRVEHPRMDELLSEFPALAGTADCMVGPEKRISATFNTPQGLRHLP